MSANSLFGLPRNAVVILIGFAAMLLTILAGVLALAVFAMRALISPGADSPGAPIVPLLIAIIVLLLAIFGLLVMLLRCACGSGKRDVPPDLLAGLLPFLPVFTHIPDALRAVAIALHESGKTIGWMAGKINAAGQTLVNVADSSVVNNFEITVPTFQTSEFGTSSGLYYVTNVDLNHKTALDVVKGSLNSAGVSLSGSTGVVTIDGVSVNLGQVTADLLTAGKAIGLIAKALNRTPPPEVIQ